MEPSTEASRREGLDILTRFLQDVRYSKYPPTDINTLDMTNAKNPTPLDHFLLDDHIVPLLRETIDEGLLTKNFYQEWNEIAKMFFSGPTYPAEAVSLYGYGTARIENDNAQVCDIDQEDATDNGGGKDESSIGENEEKKEESNSDEKQAKDDDPSNRRSRRCGN